MHGSGAPGLLEVRKKVFSECQSYVDSGMLFESLARCTDALMQPIALCGKP
jgi:hypothetical protein